MTALTDKRLVTEPPRPPDQFIQYALDTALSLGDFQKEIHSACAPESVAEKAVKRINRLALFDASAIYLVDEETSDLLLASCSPPDSGPAIENELEFMIDKGFVAWAIRERRGITVYAKDGGQQLLLHVLATYSRTRGLFVGIFPSQLSGLPDGAMEILSIILRNAANCIESIIYSGLMRQRQKRLEAEVAQKTQEVVRYEKQFIETQNKEAIATLAGGVAHEFNNALTGLIGNIDLISMNVPTDSVILPYVERTRPIVARMSTLTQQLLAYASGGQHIAQSTTLKHLYNEIVPAIQLVVKKTIDLVLDLKDEQTAIDVDVVQLQAAIVAIVQNANESIDKKGTITIRGQRCPWNALPQNVRREIKPDACVVIDIRDDGRGMDENTRRRMFEPFFTTKFQGRGLSMAATAGIIRHHGGHIRVASQIEKGTCVQIYLPCACPGDMN
jgi:signal transduction histidine kinase